MEVTESSNVTNRLQNDISSIIDEYQYRSKEIKGRNRHMPGSKLEEI